MTHQQPGCLLSLTSGWFVALHVNKSLALLQTGARWGSHQLLLGLPRHRHWETCLHYSALRCRQEYRSRWH